jgi:serine/threonine-protein kinase
MTTPPPGRDSFVGYDAGDVIAGKYRLVKKLGQGGVGTVWLARNVTLDAPVAIKLIRPGLDAPDAADRMLKEARAEAKLEHPAIVRVFDFGETQQGEPFIVMELLEGHDLGDELDQSESIEPQRAVRILLPVIEALVCAHEQGIVHRDLKPENIFLAKEGKKLRPKVVDFGIAKLTQNDVVLTRIGSVLGTPAYMAPEQARGDDDVDHRVDTWAMCVVLYETVTGERPFRGDNYNAVLRAVIEDAVTPLAERGIFEPELWRIVQIGLDKERSKRWQSMRELGAALAAWLVKRGVTHDIVGEPLAETWLASAHVAELTEEEPVSVAAAEPARESDLPHSVDVQEERSRARRRRRVAVWLGLAGVVALGVLWFKIPAEASETAALPTRNSMRLGQRMIFDYVAAAGQAEPRTVQPVRVPVPQAALDLVPDAGTAKRQAAPAPMKGEAGQVKPSAVPAQPERAEAGAPPADPSADLKDPY